jgi:hypothetical protein
MEISNFLLVSKVQSQIHSSHLRMKSITISKFSWITLYPLPSESLNKPHQIFMNNPFFFYTNVKIFIFVSSMHLFLYNFDMLKIVKGEEVCNWVQGQNRDNKQKWVHNTHKRHRGHVWQLATAFLLTRNGPKPYNILFPSVSPHRDESIKNPTRSILRLTQLVRYGFRIRTHRPPPRIPP